MVDIFPELNQKMSTVKLMEKHRSHQELKLSQEELNKNHMLNTIPVSEVNLLIMLRLPILLRLLLKSLESIEEKLASQK